MLTTNDRQQQTVTALIQTERTDREMTEKHLEFFTLNKDNVAFAIMCLSDVCYKCI